jgi:HAMP domain-containing protein
MSSHGSLLRRRDGLAFVARVAVVFLVASAVLAGVLLVATDRDLGEVYGAAIARMRDVDEVVTVTVALVALGLVATLSAAVAITALLASFRIAGPLFRLERSFESLAAGDLGLRIRFRPRDQGEGLADTFNRLSAALRDRRSRVRACREECLALVAEVRALDDSASPETREALRARLEGALDRLEAAVGPGGRGR